MNYHIHPSSPSAKRILFLPDSHHPYEDQTAMEAVVKIAEYLRPDVLGFHGDQMDCSQFSRHAKRTFDQSIAQSWRHEEAAAFLEDLERLEPYAKEFVYLEGNHEAWVKSHLIKTLGPEMALDVYELYSPRALVEQCLVDKGDKPFFWVDYDSGDVLNHYEIAPNLWAIHGWSHSKYAATKHLDKAKTVSITYGHTHRKQLDSTRIPATNAPLYSWSPGCLCEFAQNYTYHSGPTDWTHGVTVIYQSRANPNNWTHYVVPIDRGYCVLPDGKEIRA